MSNTNRRQFVQLAGALALALRHGLLPAKSTDTAGPTAAAASFGDSAIHLEWDSNLHARVSRVVGGRRTALTSWDASEYLLRADGKHLANFVLQPHPALDAINDANGRGRRITLSGQSAEKIEKTLTVTLYDRYPGFAVVRASYKNLSGNALALLGWTCGDHVVQAGRPDRAFWSYSGATYEDRRDWVQAVKPGFEQDNFLGMEASDYGGGTPIVDVWRHDAGLAVGHVETVPKLVSLPLQEQHGRVRVAVCSRDKRTLDAGAGFATLDTFISAHQRDHFATLTTYRQVMADRGMQPAHAGPASYEPIWCAWGYERDCTTKLIIDTLPKVKDLGLKWAVIDDGWQAKIGDWTPHPVKYPKGEADLRALVTSIRAQGLKPRLWYSPLSVAPGADALHDHADMLLLDKEGSVQKISWWNSFYLCPAYAPTIAHTQALITQFIGDWGFAGLKVDGQHLNGVAPCFNPAHKHARPEESVEGLQNFYRAMYEAALQADPDAVVEICPCGTAYSAFNFPYMNQAPASDPENSWQVRLKGKTLKGLMGASAPFAGDHVELSDNQNDFASTVGIGAVVSTKFTWPVDPKPKDSFLLTPEKEVQWRKWIALYQEKMLPLGTYRGELYDIGFDEPETHAIEKSGRLYYAFFADRFSGDVALRGLQAGRYRIRDYFNDRDLGQLTAPADRHRLAVNFQGFLLLEANQA
ncbi:MAG: glycoside hydrolase family 36 protein [Steroidobacteraceae bacterium]